MPLPVTQRKSTGIGLRTMARWLRVSHVYLRDMELGHRPFRPEIAARYRTGLAKLNGKKPNARPSS